MNYCVISTVEVDALRSGHYWGSPIIDALQYSNSGHYWGSSFYIWYKWSTNWTLPGFPNCWCVITLQLWTLLRFLISADINAALYSRHYWGSPIIDDTLTLDITEVPHFFYLITPVTSRLKPSHLPPCKLYASNLILILQACHYII